MIVTERKPLEEIIAQLEGARSVLVVGCGTCAAVCMAGGEREVALLATELRMALKLRGIDLTVDELTVQRQCDEELLRPARDAAAGHDVVLSAGCGAGVQMLAALLTPARVAPALDTRFIGATIEPGYWVERCRACGSCLLGLTGGICPVARCAKSLLNGPCGGSSQGRCEVGEELECAWQLIYDRLKAQGRLEGLSTLLEPRDHGAAHGRGPRSLRRGGERP